MSNQLDLTPPPPQSPLLPLLTSLPNKQQHPQLQNATQHGSCEVSTQSANWNRQIPRLALDLHIIILFSPSSLLTPPTFSMEEKDNPSPTTALPSPRSVQPDANNPYPTTFVQADYSTFKQVVQMLTGTAETASAAAAAAATNQQPPKNVIPPKPTGPKKPAFKLYERRNSLKNNLNIINPKRFMHQHQQQEILSPSMLDFPSLVLSPVTPLIADPFNRSAEEKAIAEKGFYLIPSPRSASETPRLLPLFPLTSPRASNSQSP